MWVRDFLSLQYSRKKWKTNLVKDSGKDNQAHFLWEITKKHKIAFWIEKYFVKSIHNVNLSLIKINLNSRKFRKHSIFTEKSTFFPVKSTLLLNKLVKSWFHGNSWVWSRFIVLFAQCFSVSPHTLWQILSFFLNWFHDIFKNLHTEFRWCSMHEHWVFLDFMQEDWNPVNFTFGHYFPRFIRWS